MLDINDGFDGLTRMKVSAKLLRKVMGDVNLAII